MLDAICPSCGRGGSLPKNKVNTRLVCRNCQQVFHVTATNTALKGEPPAVIAESHKRAKTAVVERPREPSELDLSGVRTPFKLAGVALIVLVIGWLAYPYLFSGPETLEQRSIQTARAILDKNDARLQRFVAQASWTDAKQWVDLIYPKLDSYRNRWPGHDLNVSALVINENRGTGRAEVVAYYTPPLAAARTGSASGDILIDSSGKTEPMGLTLSWRLDSSGSWTLDPKASAQANP